MKEPNSDFESSVREELRKTAAAQQEKRLDDLQKERSRVSSTLNNMMKDMDANKLINLIDILIEHYHLSEPTDPSKWPPYNRYTSPVELDEIMAKRRKILLRNLRRVDDTNLEGGGRRRKSRRKSTKRRRKSRRRKSRRR